MGRSWALINSSSMFRQLALCMAVVGVVSEGIQDMLLQYLQLVMGFNTADQAVLITVLGAGNFVVQVSSRCGAGLLASCVSCCRCCVHATSQQQLGRFVIMHSQVFASFTPPS